TPIQYQLPTDRECSLRGPFAGKRRGAAPPAVQLRRTERVSDETKPLLVFFWSERSGPARRMESLLAHLARKERTRLRVMRVDVDEQSHIALRFNVADVPTLVRVEGKRVVDRIEGRASAATIDSMLQRHLAAQA